MRRSISGSSPVRELQENGAIDPDVPTLTRRATNAYPRQIGGITEERISVDVLAVLRVTIILTDASCHHSADHGR